LGGVTLKTYLEAIKSHIESHPLNFGDADSVLTMLYECYSEINSYDNEQIQADFDELYQQMNGMTLREMDQVIYPVCKLCRDHEKAGFIEGIKIGIRFSQELM
jgi:hypothetical protein